MPEPYVLNPYYLDTYFYVCGRTLLACYLFGYFYLYSSTYLDLVTYSSCEPYYELYSVFPICVAAIYLYMRMHIVWLPFILYSLFVWLPFILTCWIAYCVAAYLIIYLDMLDAYCLLFPIFGLIILPLVILFMIFIFMCL